MDRLHSDSSLLVCPAFTSECYRASHAPFISATITEEQAAESLRLVWVTTNEDLCTQWQQQLTEDTRLRAEQELTAEAEATRLCQVHQLEEETARTDERKKNRFKHTDIMMHPQPDTNEEETFVSDFALRKIDKGHFVELYYWTNSGLEEALFSYSTRDNEGLIPSEQDGAMVWISAAASKPSKHVVPDRFLSPVDFAQAVPRIVAALEEHDWPNQRVLMLARFWGAIMTHRYWNSNNQIAQRALMIYQEEQRRAWHMAVALGNGAWDLSIISDTMLACLFDRVLRESRHRDHESQVSTYRLAAKKQH
ncbi:uncharacterized protein F5891DRAFT_944792 [Suillus fuscotomentosus]|uniref:Uncharacterized protein n=1 Tax=Suillus fuscotomentosus TaxID=1912939 RepID=A0AAD4HQ38_9AGAM|nr:uncharacterized protein F5891DRAFT_944792 [Suillus fuscotomentosus]KAG1904843.1 hypothetical protein F5891DRAFT_944792 [Suillus fuscotomentosus]